MNPLKIIIPEGTEAEIDHENRVVVFNPIKKEGSLPTEIGEIRGLPSKVEWHVLQKLFPTEEMRDAFKALRELILLRDAWNGEWRADWEDNETKYCLGYYENEPTNITAVNHSQTLHFKSKDLAERFLKQFKDLIEQAKELL